MSVDVTVSKYIPRPRAEVAAFMFDPRNDPRWNTGAIDVKPLDDGPLRTGVRVERVSRFLGRRFSYLLVVTAHEDERAVDLAVDHPFPMRIEFRLADAEGDGDVGTRVSIRVVGEPHGFFRFTGGLLDAMVKRSVRADLDRLAECLVAGTSVSRSGKAGRERRS